jgi:putative MATE family efflux protein
LSADKNWNELEGAVGEPSLSCYAASELGTGNVRQLLTQYSIPAIVAITTASLYNIIDRVFIGHGVGPMAISGLALTLPMMNVAAAFGSLVGAGGAALVSIRLGERNREEADAILGNTLFLNLVFGSIVSFVFLLFLDPILLFIGGSRETIPYARQFMQIILLGNIFTHLYLGMNNVMRASGYPHKAMVNTLTTVAVNLVLAPLFIFVFGWGIRGAALATVIAQIIGTAGPLPHFLRAASTVHFCRGCFRPQWKIIEGILSIGMSNFAMLSCASLVQVIVNLRLMRYGGDFAIGAFGIINTLAMLFVTIAMGVNQGMQPIAGYNFGARHFDRVKLVYRDAVIAATCATSCGFLLAELFPRAVASAFTGDPQLVAQSAKGMRLILAMFPIVGFQMVTSNLFQSIGKAKISIVLSLSRQVLFLIPALVVLPLYWGLNGVWLAGPSSDLAATLTTLLVLKTQFRRLLGGPAQETGAASGEEMQEVDCLE